MLRGFRGLIVGYPFPAGPRPQRLARSAFRETQGRNRRPARFEQGTPRSRFSFASTIPIQAFPTATGANREASLDAGRRTIKSPVVQSRSPNLPPGYRGEG